MKRRKVLIEDPNRSRCSLYMYNSIYGSKLDGVHLIISFQLS